MEYNIGDVVTIVEEPYKDCRFSWVVDMNRYCGKSCVIKDKVPSKYAGYCYVIDSCSWNFCAGCFQETYKDKELAPLDDDILSSIMGG